MEPLEIPNEMKYALSVLLTIIITFIVASIDSLQIGRDVFFSILLASFLSTVICMVVTRNKKFSSLLCPIITALLSIIIAGGNGLTFVLPIAAIILAFCFVVASVIEYVIKINNKTLKITATVLVCIVSIGSVFYRLEDVKDTKNHQAEYMAGMKLYENENNEIKLARIIKIDDKLELEIDGRRDLYFNRSENFYEFKEGQKVAVELKGKIIEGISEYSESEKVWEGEVENVWQREDLPNIRLVAAYSTESPEKLKKYDQYWNEVFYVKKLDFDLQKGEKIRVHYNTRYNAEIEIID